MSMGATQWKEERHCVACGVVCEDDPDRYGQCRECYVICGPWPRTPAACDERAGEMFGEPAVLFIRRSDGHCMGYRREPSS